MDFSLARQDSLAVHFISLGCARNLVDTEVMLGSVLKAGYALAQTVPEADFLVVNTCGFLESAREEAYRTLEEIFQERKKGAKVIVAGCMVQNHRLPLKARFPDIHYFLSAGDVDKILDALTVMTPGEAVSPTRKSFLQVAETPRLPSTPKHFAYLKIAEGCKKRCSFCIIPTIKGKLQSKSIEQVEREFRALLQSKVKEVILIAQDLGDFGKDMGHVKGNLAELLETLDAIPGDFWIRLLYLYPDEITDDIIRVMQNSSKILPYIDMPIQHINDRILKRMHRKTGRAHIEATIQKLRREIPDIVIRTSLMVGFPGETEDEFEELLAFVKEGHIDNIGFFTYSREELSHSATLEGHLSEEVKQERLLRIVGAQQEALRAKLLPRFLGKKVEVVIDRKTEEEGLYVGHAKFQCPDVDGVTYVEGHNLTVGRTYPVRITAFDEYDLVGKVNRSTLAMALQ